MACRVVAAGAEGFTYATLPGHPERGVESFAVRRDGDVVTFEVVATSAPAHPLARLVPPAASLLQDRACRRYLAAASRLQVR